MIKDLLINLVLTCATVCFPQSDAYNILGIFPTMSKSHFISGSALMKGLALAGHNVSVISPFPQPKRIPNYRDITADGIEKIMSGKVKFVKQKLN